MTVGELCERSVINMSSGSNLGNVDDVIFCTDNAEITHIVIYGRLKLFGILGRDDDTFIPWGDIKKIGEDVLLVETTAQKKAGGTSSTRKGSIIFG